MVTWVKRWPSRDKWLPLVRFLLQHKCTHREWWWDEGQEGNCPSVTLHFSVFPFFFSSSQSQNSLILFSLPHTYLLHSLTSLIPVVSSIEIWIRPFLFSRMFSSLKLKLGTNPASFQGGVQMGATAILGVAHQNQRPAFQKVYHVVVKCRLLKNIYILVCILKNCLDIELLYFFFFLIETTKAVQWVCW